MLTDIVDRQTSKGVPGRVDERVVGIDEFIMAEPYHMIFEGFVLEELVDEVVATQVQVEQPKFSGRGWTSLGGFPFVTRFLDDRCVDRELPELRQIVQDAEECPGCNIRNVEPYTPQGVRDWPEHLSDRRWIFPRRAGVRNELGDLEGFQYTPTIGGEVFGYGQDLICVPVERVLTPHE